jgi:hypothetical protein
MSRTQTERAKQAKDRSGDAASVAKFGSSRSDPEADAGVRAARNPQDRWAMIAQLAYFRAEQRGFAPGGELQDWLDAEAEVDAARVGRGNSPTAA